MIIPDKKKTVSIILSKMKKDGSEKSQEVAPEGDLGEASPVKGIAEDVLQAFSDKSVSDMTSALQALCDYIEVAHEGGETETEVETE